MVDFQSRDAHRGTVPSGEDDTEDGTDEEGGRSEEDENGKHAHGHEDHAHAGPTTEDLGIAVVTISSTRTRAEDASGDAIVAACEAARASVETRELLADDYDLIQETLGSLAERPAIDVIVTAGGTGVTPDDVTVEAARPLFDKELRGFGELFRRYSEAEIGTRIVATRATAGVLEGVPVFCLPGSENAAELGTEEIVLPEAAHLVGLAGGDRGGEDEGGG